MFAHSKYSITFGVKSPEAIINWGKEHLFPTMIIADINSTTAILSSVKYAQECDYKIIAGTDIRNDVEQCYLIIAQNNRGFHEVNEFISKHLHQSTDFPDKAPYLANCLIVYPFEKQPDDLNDNEYVGVAPHQVNRVAFCPSIPKNKWVALHQMTIETKREFNAHRLLRAIDNNCLLSQLPKAQQTSKEALFCDFNKLQEIYRSVSFVLEQTLELLASCSIHFDFGEQVKPQNISTYTGAKKGDRELIEQLCLKGCSKRYPVEQFQEREVINERIQREINVIEQKDYLSYFLVTWDIIHYAKSKGYFHVGRGSGANSIVAYLLGITDVDPLELDLYFERFINLYRKNPPDFDIDFSWKERDEIMHYIFNRFPNTALLCTYNTFKYKGCVRELGKVMGLPKTEIDRLSSGQFQLHDLDHMSQLVLRYGKYIEGLPSHLSVHAGGIVISEQPITWFSATFLPPKGLPTTQVSMLEAEDVGLYKFDILSQRGLSKIRESIDIIRQNQPQKELHDLHDISFLKEDLRIRKLLQTGDAMGCFYVESPAMRMLMKKLKTTTYLDLVAASSIIRPGVSSSGMMKEYILRHKNEKRRRSGHPLLQEIMPETYGIMVYQEDVMKVGHHFAGLSLNEADVLRRGMSGKYRSREEFTSIRDQFFSNCLQKGYGKELTTTIWKQIESFAGYAFSKGHSASYAVESFQSLYLKAYFPLEYMVATINNFGGYYHTEFYIHEARRKGATIEAPCIQNSWWETTIQGTVIYLGFQHILGVDHKEIIRVLAYRKENGHFTSFEEILRCLHPTLENVLLLIRINAFREISTSKQELKWQVHLFYKKTKVRQQQSVLFQEETKKYKLPHFDTDILEQAYEEMELLEFPLCSPFRLLETPLKDSISASQLQSFHHQLVSIYSYLVAVKTTKTVNGKIMCFGTFQDREGIVFDTVHFPFVVEHFPFRGRGIYKLYGKVTQEFGYYSLEVKQQEKMNYIKDIRYA